MDNEHKNNIALIIYSKINLLDFEVFFCFFDADTYKIVAIIFNRIIKYVCQQKTIVRLLLNLSNKR